MYHLVVFWWKPTVLKLTRLCSRSTGGWRLLGIIEWRTRRPYGYEGLRLRQWRRKNRSTPRFTALIAQLCRTARARSEMRMIDSQPWQSICTTAPSAPPPPSTTDQSVAWCEFCTKAQYRKCTRLLSDWVGSPFVGRRFRSVQLMCHSRLWSGPEECRQKRQKPSSSKGKRNSETKRTKQNVPKWWTDFSLR